jgi:hypothetical protein
MSLRLDHPCQFFFFCELVQYACSSFICLFLSHSLCFFFIHVPIEILAAELKMQAEQWSREEEERCSMIIRKILIAFSLG